MSRFQKILWLMAFLLLSPFYSHSSDEISQLPEPQKISSGDTYAFVFHDQGWPTPKIYEIHSMSQHPIYSGFRLSENSINFDWIEKSNIRFEGEWQCFPIYNLRPSDWKTIQSYSILILDLKNTNGVKKQQFDDPLQIMGNTNGIKGVGTPPVPLPLPAPRPMVMSYGVSSSRDTEPVYIVTKEVRDNNTIVGLETVYMDLGNWVSDIGQWAMDTEDPELEYFVNQFEPCVDHFKHP